MRRLTGAFCVALLAASVLARPETADDPDRAELDRTLTALERSPRLGPVFDRAYAAAVTTNRVDAVLKTYRDRLAAKPDGAAALLIGLFELQRGREGAAVQAFGRAEELRPADPLPPYYLGRALVRIGRAEDAAAAFGRALDRKPGDQRTYFEIAAELARLHQRAERPEQALAVWRRVEDRYPDNAPVREQVADALAEDGQLAAALERYEKLAKDAESRRHIDYRLRAAELKDRLNRRPDAQADYARLLDDVDPGEFHHAEARRRLEDLFLRSDDTAGLIVFYKARLAKNPDDVTTLERLAHFLVAHGQAAEARDLLLPALGRSPRNAGLRRALIAVLTADHKFAAAAELYALLDKHAPDDPDTLREWGQMLLRDADKPEADRKASAAAVWDRLLPRPGRPADPNKFAVAADLFRGAGMSDRAVELYRRASAAAPDVPRFRIQLGEFLHELGRKPEAMAAWRGLAEGGRRTARNLETLATVLADFGYPAEAAAALADAVALAPDELSLRLAYADHLTRLEKPAEALVQLDAAERIADSPADKDAVLSRRLESLRAAGRLTAEADKLRRELEAGKDATALRWYRLARYSEAARQAAEAVAACRQVTARESEFAGSALLPLVLKFVARTYEAAGKPQEAADTLRRLATVDRRGRADHLSVLARLEARRGNRAEALAAGREFLAAAPGNPEHYRFLAGLHFQFGETDDGLAVLRRAVKINRNERGPRLALAQALADQFQTDEAIAVYWKLFEDAESPEEKLSCAGRLSELHMRVGQLDRLLSRLARMRDEAPPAAAAGPSGVAPRRLFSLCIAQANQAAGDFRAARQELERLAADAPGDTAVLRQLVNLCDQDGDLNAAIHYQRQVAKMAPGEDGGRLESLLLRAGLVEEAVALWGKQAGGGRDPGRMLPSCDNLLLFKEYARALTLATELLRDHPRDWEALYRRAIAAAAVGQLNEAAQAAETLLGLPVADDALTVMAPPNAGGPARLRDAEDAFLDRLEVARKMRPQVELYLDLRFDPPEEAAKLWSPVDFGQARMAALALLDGLARKRGEREAFRQARKALYDRSPEDPRAAWNWFWYLVARTDFTESHRVARGLLRGGELAAHYAYLETLENRFRVPPRQRATESKPPLDPEELGRMRASVAEVRRRRPDWFWADDASILRQVLDEFQWAKCEAEGDELYRAVLPAATTAEAGMAVLRVAGARGDLPAVRDALRQVEAVAHTPQPIHAEKVAPLVQAAIRQRAAANAGGDVIGLLDAYLDADRRGAWPRGQALQQNRPAGVTTTYTVGKTRRSFPTDYPPARDEAEYHGLHTAMLTMVAAERCHQLPALKEAIRRRADQAPPGRRAAELQLLAALSWWDGDRDGARAVLAGGHAAAPGDLDVGLELAQLDVRLHRPADGLAVLDALPADDAAALEKRERAALQLAAQARDVGRAGAAAERLFGLRLDVDTQIELAGLLTQLGKADRAVALLSRARQQSGNNVRALNSLMAQYRSGGRPDQAAEVAFHLLRLIPWSAFAQTSRELAGFRDAALTVLADSGRLKPFIDRTEKQLQAAPRSRGLYAQMREMLLKANDRPRLLRLYDIQTKQFPDDHLARMRIGTNHADAGDLTGAIPHYKAAIHGKPALLTILFPTNRDKQLPNYFQRAGRLGDYAELLDGVDFGRVGSPLAVANAIDPLLSAADQRPAGVRLLTGALAALPEQRLEVIESLSVENLKLPEVIAPAAAALRDRMAAETVPVNWELLTNSSVALLGESLHGESLAAVADAARAALGRNPDWYGGRVLLGLARLRQGAAEEARDVLRPLVGVQLADVTDTTITHVAGALSASSVVRDALLHFRREQMVRSLADRSNLLTYRGDLQEAVGDFRAAGLWDEARGYVRRVAEALRAGRAGNSSSSYHMSSTARLFEDFDLPLDAARMVWASETAGTSVNSFERNQFAAVVERFRRDASAEALAELLTIDPARPTLEQYLAATPEAPEKARLTGLLVEAARGAGGRPEVRAEVGRRLDELVKARPNDVAATAAAAAFSLEAGGAADALARLERLLKDHPLPPAAGRPNAKSAADALPRVGIWLVARECLPKPALRSAGRRLAAEAAAAARRQLGNAYAAAVLREWGEIELQLGDRAAADRAWGELLDVLLAPPARLPLPLARAAGPLSADQFAEIGRFALFLAQRGSTGLSLRAARDALRGGPPVVLPVTPTRRTIPTPDDEATPTTPGAAVSAFFDGGLLQAWQNWRVPPADIYQALAAAVLPDARPTEVFDASPAYSAGEARPTTLGDEVLDWADRGGRRDDLRRRLAARPTAAAGQGLLVRLELRSGDKAAGRAAVDKLSALVSAKDAAPELVEAALPGGLAALATDDPALAPPAAGLIERAARRLTHDPKRGGSFDYLFLELARADFRAGRAEAGRRHLQEYAEPGVLQSRQGWSVDRAARVAAAFGEWAAAWEFLGKYAELTADGTQESAAAGLLDLLAAELAGRPPARRYEFLKAWVLPGPDHRILRQVYGSSDHGDEPPAAFGRGRARDPREILHTSELLVEAAKSAGRVDDLIAAVSPLTDQKLTHAAELLMLARVAAGRPADAEAFVRERVEQRTDPTKNQGGRRRIRTVTSSGQSFTYFDNTDGPTFDRWADDLVARAGLADARLRPLATRLADALLASGLSSGTRTYSYRTRNFSADDGDDGSALWRRLWLARATAELPAGSSPGPVDLRDWRAPAADRTGWVVEDGCLTTVPGTAGRSLWLAVPLTGDFELHFEATARPVVTFGGVTFGSMIFGGYQVFGAETWEAETPFASYVLRVRGGKGQLFDAKGQAISVPLPLAGDSPWLELRSPTGRPATFRAIRLTGTPKAPRTVDLLAGRRPPQTALPPEWRRFRYRNSDDEDEEKLPKPPEGGESWQVVDGMLVEARIGPRRADRPVSAREALARPLQPGDVVRYEFLYRPGETEVHPALGPLVFLLGPDGVRLHWADEYDGPGLRLTPDNAVAVPAERRGPAPPPLRPGEWNSLELTIDVAAVRLSLNGTAVYEHPLGEAADRQFGLFHFADRTDARVRKLVLTGTWPAEVPTGTDLIRPVGAPSESARRLARALTGEALLSAGAADVARRARGLKPGERFAALRAWVLPGPDNSSLRLAARFAADGELYSPAADLVVTAAELGRLGELPETAGTHTDAVAWHALLAAAHGRDDVARADLDALRTAADRPGADDAVWPAALAAWQAARRPALHEPAIKLLAALIVRLDTRAAAGNPRRFSPVALVGPLALRVRAAAAAAVGEIGPLPAGLGLIVPPASESDPDEDDDADADTPRPRAGVIHGSIHLLPGPAGTGVQVVSPLTGDFEATWTMTAPYGGWPEVNFAGAGVALKPDRTGYELVTRSTRRDQPLVPPLEAADGRLPGRLRVRGGIVTIEVDGRVLLTEAVAVGVDPWLSFLSPAGLGGGIADLRLNGSPAVPPAVEPAAAPDLAAWRSWRDLSVGSNFGGWSKAGPEVRRRRGEMPRPISLVGMLNYQRPVFEDGVISYQFRHEAGRAVVHPAVGGIAFLLEPGGVTEYHAAAARFDDPKPAHKEVAVSRKGPKELPLRPGDWNRVEIAVAKGKLTLTLNDLLVYERRWATAAGQCFGLCADAGEAPIRVRDVRWRGDWPRTVADLKLGP